MTLAVVGNLKHSAMILKTLHPLAKLDTPFMDSGNN
jgi:hypothetical protein